MSSAAVENFSANEILVGAVQELAQPLTWFQVQIPFQAPIIGHLTYSRTSQASSLQHAMVPQRAAPNSKQPDLLKSLHSS